MNEPVQHHGGRGVYRRKEPQEASLNITSMIDVLTILLIFLLMSYSVDPQLLYSGPDVLMPESFARDSMTRTVQIAVNEDRILVDGKEILVGLPEYTSREDVLMLEPLQAMLEMKKIELQEREAEQAAKMKAAGKEGEEDKPWTGTAIIQADRDITFNVLKRVMYTADRSGFPTQSLALLAKTQ